MQKQYQQEADIQAGYRNQALGPQGPIQTGIRQSSPEAMTAGVDAGAALRNKAYGDIAKVPLGSGFSRQSEYNPSADDAYLGLVGKARANLGGYSDWAVQQSINNLRNQQALNQIISFAGGQAKNVYPLKVYEAQHANDAMAAIGQAISSIGGAAGNYAQLYGQQPTAPSYQSGFVNSGGLGGGAYFSGYGGYGNLPPAGTSYSPWTDQNTIGYGGGFIPGY
jgi:hypothetical protein